MDRMKIMNDSFSVMLATPPGNLAEGGPIKRVVRTQPIGLLYIASYLKARKYGNIHVLDGYSFGYDPSRVEERLKAWRPNIIGISSVTINFHDALALARLCKDVLKEAVIVIGGMHASARPLDAFEEPAVDVVGVGEGEEIFYRVCEALKNGGDLSGVKGICYRNGDGIRENPPAPLLHDLDRIPFPDHSLLPPISRYNPYPHWGDGGLFSTIITSRGCPYGCIFCSISRIQGRRYRGRSPENVLEELRTLNREYGVDHFSLRDGTVGVDKKRLKKICYLIIEEGLKIKWNCNLTIREGGDSALLLLMKKAGCRGIQFGIESGDSTLIREIKKISLKEVKRTIDLTSETGIEPHGYFMFGLPGETMQSMKNTLKTALEMKFATVGFTVATPFPGTDLYEYYNSRNLINHENWRAYDAQSPPVFTPEHIDGREIFRFMKHAYRRYYLRPEQIRRRIKKLTPSNLGIHVQLAVRYLLGFR